MYGNKQERQERLQTLVTAINRSGGTLTQAALARLLGVSRSTITKDLVALHEQGALLAEDENGRLSVLPSNK